MTTQTNLDAHVPHAGGIGAALTVLIAFACGALVANLYYAQPLVSLIGRSANMPAGADSMLVTATQLGYGLGLILLVPLGDILENRRVIVVTMAATVVALIGLAMAPGAGTLFLMMFVVGASSTAAQMLVPLAAHLARSEERGRVVGNVMSGLLGGILLARPLASFLADWIGWRGVFLLSAVIVAATALVCRAVLPQRRPEHSQSYGALLLSMGRLIVEQPLLRRRALFHSAMFCVFTIFWTGAPIILMRAPFDFTATGVAVFALAGVLGIFAAPVAGRLADRGHSRAGTAAAMMTVIAALVIAYFGSSSLSCLVAAAILIDLGVQANLVISQREIYGLAASVRSRLNAVFMAVFFLGGAIGSALTSPVLSALGWHGLILVSLLFPAAALAYFSATELRAR
ncbi:MFS transporter [Consotaella salsifontis]|uniref:Predicted arabinose efflux permease, MFS family n=1 Tax=Consotaella salsifontis TaxID=1365950 RepID=A0A1T4M9D2_9HYPH|nr:MFS transporter [Consotaella salsifontis]SJZ63398.1 Predicted arabinose efflux permease, MFS family [Consotaella salsifontis]